MFAPIDIESFKERTGIRKEDLIRFRGMGDVIVSLRELVEVRSVQAMPIRYLERMLRAVPLLGDASVRPYADAVFSMVRMDPNSLLVGQTFVERPKLQCILENFGGLWSEFCVTRGIAKRTPWIVFGRTADGRDAIAHYLPPIAEAHTGRLYLLDGVHRNYLVKAIGTTVETIIIRCPTTAFPCECRTWDDVRPVDGKPPKDERFHGLQPDLFRDVKAVGIDG